MIYLNPVLYVIFCSHFLKEKNCVNYRKYVVYDTSHTETAEKRYLSAQKGWIWRFDRQLK